MGSYVSSVPKARRSDYRRVAEGVRNQILNGEFVSGMRLPAMEKLAESWKTSFGTIHNALEALSKEGWVERVHGSGTYVAEFKTRFSCAGIYYDHNFFSDEDSAFSRSVHAALLAQLDEMGRETMIFVDSRPLTRQWTALPALAEAIAHRRIQCVIAPLLNKAAGKVVAGLNLPTSFCGYQSCGHHVDFSLESLIVGSVGSLAQAGCRSIGLMSHIKIPDKKHIKDYYDDFFPCFQRAARANGLAVHEEWIRRPTKPVADIQLFGYRQFKKLWALREKPEGLVIYPDLAVRGAILAILEIGIEKVTSRMKFVLHRNSHVRLLCPFSATWTISSEDLLAKELIRMILRQFDGKKVEPVSLPYTFKQERAIR